MGKEFRDLLIPISKICQDINVRTTILRRKKPSSQMRVNLPVEDHALDTVSHVLDQAAWSE